MGLGSAVALNMLDMIGVGPFVTLPLIVLAMHGPQAILGWVLGAVLAMCDGLVWAELGASMPHGGRIVRIPKADLRARRTGAHGFVPVHLATDVQRAALDRFGVHRALVYAGYLWPNLRMVIWQHSLRVAIPLLGPLEANLLITPGTWVAMARVPAGACCCSIADITSIGRLSKWLWGGVMLTLAWIISAGVTHFHAAQAFDFPPGAFTPSREFFTGLGAAMLIATYDYWGAYNICFPRRRGEGAGAHRAARGDHFHRGRRVHLHADEHQRAGRHSIGNSRRAGRAPMRAPRSSLFSCSRFMGAGRASW